MAKQKKTLKQFFLGASRDSQGKTVIAQQPNTPIIVWALASLLGLISDSGSFGRALDIIALSSLVYWALLETFNGVNLFRRTLGIAVMLLLILNRI